MTTIDHAAEAEVWLANADDEYTRRTPIRANIRDAYQRAQVHAQLALVEQQRIANLIALQRHEAKYDIGADRSALYKPDPDAEGMFCEELRDDIKKGLGLS